MKNVNHREILSVTRIVSWFTGCVVIVNRLTNLRDPGLSHMVYPGAVHTRFEHSLGVYWLAGKAMDVIKFACVDAACELWDYTANWSNYHLRAQNLELNILMYWQ